MSGEVPGPLTWGRLGATDVAWPAVVMVLCAAGLYLWGAWRIGRMTPGEPWHVRRSVAFVAGLLVTSVAIFSVIGVYDGVLFYDHMVQHLALIMVAAPLFAMGAPIELLARSTSGRLHELVTAALGSRVAEAVGHPVTGFVLYAVFIPFAHLTSFYNLTLEHEAVHNAEHMVFLVVGYLFWRPVVGIEPSRHPLAPGLRLVYLALAVPVDTFTGLALVSASHEMFPAYAALHRTWGPSLVEDLHEGGATMWIGGDLIMLLAMIPVAVHWVRDEDRKTVELDRRLDAEREERRASP